MLQIIVKVELQQGLSAISMKASDELTVLFERISAIENKYNTATFTTDNKALFAVVLDAAPAAYKAILTTEQGIKGTALTMEDLESTMMQQWRQTFQKKPENKNTDSNKITLMGSTTTGSFNGTCYNCQQKGHRANQCPTKKKGKNGGNSKGNSSLKCTNCGKPGHVEAKSWDLAANSGTRPAWYPTKKRWNK